jgi:hypothetical protein
MQNPWLKGRLYVLQYCDLHSFWSLSYLYIYLYIYIYIHIFICKCTYVHGNSAQCTFSGLAGAQMMRGGRFASRGGGGHCWYNYMRKDSRRTSSGQGSGQTLRGSSTPPRGFWPLLNLPDCFGASERFVFKVQKLPNG